MIYTFKTQGTCCKSILADIDEDTLIINSLVFVGGCPGNLQALSKLLTGKNIQEVISLFKGNTCGNKNTSCMDQLAQCLETLVPQHV